MEDVILVGATTLTALLAGVFFGYSTSVNWALGKLQDEEYIKAMQHINIVIINPLFMLSFIGPVFLLPLAAYLFRDHDGFTLLAGAAVIYILFVFILTMIGNVPLNYKLAAFKIKNAPPKEVAALRELYEKPWNRLHTMRTVAAILAATLAITAVFEM